jgi:hypothetical protein
LDEENGFFYARVDLDCTQLPTSKSGKEMMSKGFFNFSYNDTRLFGNLNLNIGKNKKAVVAENEELKAEIARLKELAGE